MNEEEKRSIKFTKEYLEEEKNLRDDYKWKSGFYANGDIERLLNLIEKQQKEIERLKEFEKYYENEKVVWQRKDYISKEKIREKLEKIEELYDEKAKAENFEYNNNQFIVDFIALVEELFEV